ncbi:MAG: hypothetical protein KGL45_12655 [Gammaproteobacteria bacterium]|nr:hypothetical protein [Gammaproteobacteria bacterium]
MSSFSRNTRRANSRLRLRALGAGLSLALASGAALADEAHRFVFTAYSDATGGAEVIAGRYRAALEELAGSPGTVELDPSASNTNRCVAYSMTLQWQKAHATCDAAIRDARTQRVGVPGWLGWTEESEDEYVALAYCNRAVMDWMSHDEAAAEKDLLKAQELAPGADFVARNVAALQRHVALARAAAPAPKS